ncbi:MAG: hypothetical protein Q8N73_02670 [bacterium]|nr:hypothetical protein [bacterium]
MYKKIWILVISVILILTISGNVVAKEILSVKIELEDGSVIIGEIEEPLIISVKTKEGIKKIDIEDIVYLQMNRASSISEILSTSVWALEPPLYIITGKDWVKGFMKFCQEIRKSFGETSTLAGYPLIEGVEKHLEHIKQSNTIFLILPKTEEFEALKELREKYPELFPISSEEFKEFNKFSPLIYLTYDIKTEKMRGVIIADKVDASLAKMLLEKDLPLNTFLRYGDGQLKEIKEE